MSFIPSPQKPMAKSTHAGSNRGTIESALSVIKRLRQTIAAENEDIGRRGPVDYQAYNLRKSHGLLELNRLVPALAGIRGSLPLQEALADLSAILENNRKMLRVQLSAAETVSNIIARAIRDSQSDGTYSALAWRDDEE
jgi:hypothetical protein